MTEHDEEIERIESELARAIADNDRERESLKRELKWWKEHAESLDANWSKYHDFCLNHLKTAMKMSDEATIPEMASEIQKLQRFARETNHDRP